MSPASRFLPFAAVVALLVACSDASSPTQVVSDPGSPMASKGSGSGGGGGGGGGSAQLVITTPPTVDATGTFVGTSDGPDITHSYTFRLKQASDGIVSGTGTTTTPFMTAAYTMVGTVNGDTLMLYVGGTCGSCTLTPTYRGIVAPDGSIVDGKFLNGGVSPVTLYRQ